jgi:hypothetical protein
MAEKIPGIYDQLRLNRERYLRFFILSLLLIMIGFLAILAFPIYKIVLLVLLFPTFFGGYSAGVFCRNLMKEYLISIRRPAEDAELGSILAGIATGILGTIALAGMQVLFILLLRTAGMIV